MLTWTSLANARRAAMSALTLALIAGAVAGSASAQTKPVPGGTAILAVGADPATLNPDVTSGIPDQLVGCILYQGLTRVDANGDVHLVESPDHMIVLVNGGLGNLHALALHSFGPTRAVTRPL
mgnify:CR=1 FL=1